jgi:hypothetical protein
VPEPVVLLEPSKMRQLPDPPEVVTQNLPIFFALNANILPTIARTATDVTIIFTLFILIF